MPVCELNTHNPSSPVLSLFVVSFIIRKRHVGNQVVYHLMMIWEVSAVNSGNTSITSNQRLW
jgi:hypothetical protein